MEKGMKTPVDLSVIILSFNTAGLLKKTLASVYKSQLRDFVMEVTVCDNGSTDGSVAMVKSEFPQVRLLKNRKNLGFAAGNNPGIRRATGRYVLLLNSDTEVDPLTFATMITYMDEHPRVGAATCKLVLPDGGIDPACHRGFPTPWAAFSYFSGLERLFPRSRMFGAYHQGYKGYSTVHEVDCISGAFFFVRRNVISRVGPLDEDYYFYGEDMDWAFRIREDGWAIVYNPNTNVLHKKKQSGRAHTDENRRLRTEYYFFKYNRLFYAKNYASRYPRLLMWLIYAFFDIRMFFIARRMPKGSLEPMSEKE
jgi:GT2 family glycosyltransferase